MNKTSFKTYLDANYALQDALSIAQHHDAVSGTSRERVVDDYVERLQYGIDINDA